MCGVLCIQLCSQVVFGLITLPVSYDESECVVSVDVAILVARPRIADSLFIFTNPSTGHRYKTVKRAFQTACRRSGIEDFRFHDLRHTFASWAVQNGADLYRVSRILGHSTLQMTTRYAHLATEHLHEAVRGVATFMATTSPDSSRDPNPKDDTSAR